MIPALTMTHSTSQMHETLASDGVFKIENYITGGALKELHNEIQDKCENEAGHYEFGRNYCGPALHKFDPNSATSKVYDSPWMRELHAACSDKPHEYGKNVFATHDYKFTGDLARNGWLHFDRNWCLKFFIYLTDIDKSCGAFSCSPKSRQKGEALRNEAWKESRNYGNVKNRVELDYPELLDTYPPEPIEAKAGTLIVFDTNTFHKGGKCDHGKERLIVRLHCG